MNKRGQFYIVAAIMIVLVISGLTSVATYAIAKSKPRTIFDLSSDLNEESTRIIDYGIYNNQNTDELVRQFLDEEFKPYFLQKTENTNVIFIFGNKTNLQELRYEERGTGGVSVGTREGGAGLRTGEWASQIRDISGSVEDNQIEVQVFNTTHSFELKENQMFYFVLTEEIGEEKYVETNQ
jgi:hypothetical protein